MFNVAGFNGCNVTEVQWSKVVAACNCEDFSFMVCELQVTTKPTLMIACKPNATSSCKSAIVAWGDAYKSASNANTQDCQDDPNFKLSQDVQNYCI